MRQTPVWRRLEIVAEMNEAVRLLILSGLRQRHPRAASEELRRRMADILLGSKLAARAYGPLRPERESAPRLCPSRSLSPSPSHASSSVWESRTSSAAPSPA